MAQTRPVRSPAETLKAITDFNERIRRERAAEQKRKDLWNALHHFVRSNNRGWITSPPGDPSVRIECKPDSELPDFLAERFDLQSLGTGTRIEGGKFTPVCIFGLRLSLEK
jgi:hypothetical protein